VSFFRPARTLSLGNNYSPEYPSHFDSYCRHLSDWVNYQYHQAVTALARASLRLGEMRRGWNLPRRWNYLVMTVGNHLNRRGVYAQIAEEAAQSCKTGLSRSAVTAAPRERGTATVPDVCRPVAQALVPVRKV
jgi:hypothetical protein